MQTKLASVRHGDPVNGVYLVVNAFPLTSPKKGAEKWRGLSLMVTDGTTAKKVFLGNCQDNRDLMQFYSTWKTVRIVGKGKQNQGDVEIAADEVRYEAADPDMLTPKALRPATDYEARLDELIELLDEPLAAVVAGVFTPAVRVRFFRIPASERKHHAVLGGLAQHTIEVAELAANMALTWNSLGRPVSWSLCVAGALCHDVGKMVEYASDGYPATVGEGGLTGHIYAGAVTVDELAFESLGNTARLQLLNVLLAHHGTKEWGSPVTPATPEAIIVHLADMCSAWVQGYHEATPAHGELWAKSPICGFVWKGDRYGIEVPDDLVEAAEKQLALFDDPKPAPVPPSPFRPPAMAPAPAASDDLDDPFATKE